MDSISQILNILFAILCGWLAAYVAAKKGRSAVIWFFLGLFFSVFALLVLIFLPPVRKGSTTTSRKNESGFDGTTIDVKPIAKESSSPQEQPLMPERQEWYYLDAQRQQVGPISYSYLISLYKQGTISDSTYLWCEGMKEWRTVLDLQFNFNS